MLDEGYINRAEYDAAPLCASDSSRTTPLKLKSSGHPISGNGAIEHD